MTTRKHCAVSAAVVLATCGAVQAGPVTQTFDYDNGTQSATAEFTFALEAGRKTLRIVLSNTTDVDTPEFGHRLLTGLYFDINSAPVLANGGVERGLMATFSFIGGQTNQPTMDAAQYWAFRQDLFSRPHGQKYGLASAGLYDAFGPNDMLAPGGPHPQPNGADGGILSARNTDASGDPLADYMPPNGHMGKPFVMGTIEFMFELAAGFDLEGAMVDNVAFAFGTDPELVLVPVPLAFPMGLAGLAGVVLLRRVMRGGQAPAA